MMSVTDKKRKPEHDYSGLKNEPIGWYNLSQESLTPLGIGVAIFGMALITGLILYLGIK